MKISIIVPVYNKEKYLADCIESLTNQTYEDIEIILVDDESKDSSGIICDEYAARDTRVKVIHQKNTGAAGAWRAGFAISEGKYVMFVDADDWIDLDMVERMIAHTTNSDSEMVVSDYVIERLDHKSTFVYGTAKPGEYDRQQIINLIIPNLWGHENRRIHMSRCMKLISRKLVEDNEHYSRKGLKFAEDNALALPCIMDAYRIYIMDKCAMYHYRYVNESVVHSYDTTLVSSIEKLQRITEEMITEKFPDRAGEFIPVSWKEFIFLLMYAVKNEVRGNKQSYIANIKALCGDKYKELISITPVTVNAMSNKIIYAVMKKPSSTMCALLRVVMIAWEKKN